MADAQDVWEEITLFGYPAWKNIRTGATYSVKPQELITGQGSCSPGEAGEPETAEEKVVEGTAALKRASFWFGQGASSDDRIVRRQVSDDAAAAFKVGVTVVAVRGPKAGRMGTLGKPHASGKWEVKWHVSSHWTYQWHTRNTDYPQQDLELAPDADSVRDFLARTEPSWLRAADGITRVCRVRFPPTARLDSGDVAVAVEAVRREPAIWGGRVYRLRLTSPSFASRIVRDAGVFALRSEAVRPPPLPSAWEAALCGLRLRFPSGSSFDEIALRWALFSCDGNQGAAETLLAQRVHPRRPQHVLLSVGDWDAGAAGATAAEADARIRKHVRVSEDAGGGGGGGAGGGVEVLVLRFPRDAIPGFRPSMDGPLRPCARQSWCKSSHFPGGPAFERFSVWPGGDAGFAKTLRRSVVQRSTAEFRADAQKFLIFGSWGASVAGASVHRPASADVCADVHPVVVLLVPLPPPVCPPPSTPRVRYSGGRESAKRNSSASTGGLGRLRRDGVATVH